MWLTIYFVYNYGRNTYGVMTDSKTGRICDQKHDYGYKFLKLGENSYIQPLSSDQSWSGSRGGHTIHVHIHTILSRQWT